MQILCRSGLNKQSQLTVPSHSNMLLLVRLTSHSSKRPPNRSHSTYLTHNLTGKSPPLGAEKSLCWSCVCGEQKMGTWDFPMGIIQEEMLCKHTLLKSIKSVSTLHSFRNNDFFFLKKESSLFPTWLKLIKLASKQSSMSWRYCPLQPLHSTYCSPVLGLPWPSVDSPFISNWSP